ncbi:MAG: GNAT family N-acetyltransferase [Sedimentisphaerales bacterium]|nr:GNAT family N-acetyltransferase [Sedimentisphaerales bacterium]
MDNLDSFNTQRLHIERLREEHNESIHRMHLDERVMAHLGGPRSSEQTSDYMKQNLAHWEQHGYGIWILRDRSTGHFVGRGGLRNVVLREKNEVEVAYGLMPDFWNKGLATEFVKAVVRIAFSKIGLSSLACVTQRENLASLRVLKKTDFHFEGDVVYKGTPSLLFRRGISRELCPESWTEAGLVAEEVFAEAQIQKVEDLAYEIWNEHFTPIIGKAQVDYMLEKFQSVKAIAGQIEQGFQYYLLRTDEGFFGYTGIQQKDDELFLSKLYIKSSERGKGYGRKVVQFLEGMARDQGLEKITLTVNKNNQDTIKAYEKFGFVVMGPIVQDIGGGFVMDDYQMAKPIEL